MFLFAFSAMTADHAALQIDKHTKTTQQLAAAKCAIRMKDDA